MHETLYDLLSQYWPSGSDLFLISLCVMIGFSNQSWCGVIQGAYPIDRANAVKVCAIPVGLLRQKN